MEFVIETKGISKKYSKKTVLDNLDIHVPKGAIYGLIGKNGAGKTTFMRVVSGIVTPTEGEYFINGISSKTKEINNARKKMSTIIDTPAFYGELTVYQNMVEQCIIKGLEDYSCISELLKLVSLTGEEKKPAHKLSLGMKQRLGIAMTLVGNPELIILDEPMNGLDPQGIIDVRNLILKMNKEKGITFVISSHLLDELSKVATHFGFISNGKLIEEISSVDILKNSKVQTLITTSDMKKFTVVLDSMNLEYSVEDDNRVIVYKKLSIEDFPENVSLDSLTVQSESLESYYMDVMSGNRG